MTSRRTFLTAGSLGAAGIAGATLLGATPAAAATPTGTVFHDTYTGKSGRLPRSNSGHAYWYTGALDLVAHEGALRLSTASLARPLPGAAYQQADLGAPVSFVGAWFLLDATGGRTTNGSGVLLGAFDGPLRDPSTASAGIHVGIGLDYWAYFVLDHGTPVALAYGPYAPLPTDTLLYAEVSVTGSTATLVTPDGGTHTVTDDRIETLGRSWLTTEVTRNAETDVLGTYTALQAATG